MSGSNKIRAGSQHHNNPTQRVYQSKEQMVYGIKKTPSMGSEGTSPLRRTDKIGLSLAKKHKRSMVDSHIDRVTEDHSPLVEEGRLWLLEKKISEQKFK